MKRWLAGSLLVVLAGLLLVIVINSNRDPIAVLEEFGAKQEKYSGGRTIERNGKGEVVGVDLHGARMRSRADKLWHAIGGRRSLHFSHLFGDAEMVNLRGLISLERLDLRSTAITDVGLVHLKGLTRLETLLLATKITDAGLVHLKGLTELQKLGLVSTKITDAGLVHLTGLTGLQSLNLAYNNITDAGLVHLKGMTSLQILRLFGTKITDAGLVHLKGLTSLVLLRLGNPNERNVNTKVTYAGVVELRNALPNCKISR